MKQDCIYAIARVRSLETKLYDGKKTSLLLSESDYDSALGSIRESGWGGDTADSMTGDEILLYETQSTWALANELIGNSDVLEVLRLPQRFHNLKAAVKCAACGEPDGEVFYEDSLYDGERLTKMIRKGNYVDLPEEMRACVEEAYKNCARTGNGQMSDAVIDRACLETMITKANATGNELIAKYAELYVSYANIRIAYRAAATNRPRDFVVRSLAQCKSLDTDKLVKASMDGTEAVLEYITKAGFGAAAEALQVGNAMFERQFDNEIIALIRPLKYDSFTVGAIVAYVLARLNEIKNVRIILSGKRNKIPNDIIAERVRNTYV